MSPSISDINAFVTGNAANFFAADDECELDAELSLFEQKANLNEVNSHSYLGGLIVYLSESDQLIAWYDYSDAIGFATSLR